MNCLVCQKPLASHQEHFCDACFRLYRKPGISVDMRRRLTRRPWYRKVQDFFMLRLWK